MTTKVTTKVTTDNRNLLSHHDIFDNMLSHLLSCDNKCDNRSDNILTSKFLYCDDLYVDKS